VLGHFRGKKSISTASEIKALDGGTCMKEFL
jgi:hypothetical protein